MHYGDNSHPLSAFTLSKLACLCERRIYEIKRIVAHSQFDPFRENAAAAKKPLSHLNIDLIEWCDLQPKLILFLVKPIKK